MKWTSEIMSAPRNAAPKVSTSKPFTIEATNKSRNPLITRVNRPSVMMLIGKVRIMSKGFKVMLMRPRIIATTIAVKSDPT